MKKQLKVYLVWCINGMDEEHGYAVIAHDETEGRKLVMRMWPATKACTITEAKETTHEWQSALKEMYEKQNALLGV